MLLAGNDPARNGRAQTECSGIFTVPLDGEKVKKYSYSYWTYDYKMVGNSCKLLKENRPELRGRKFYWHSDAWEKYVNNNEEPTEMKQRIRSLRAKRGEGKTEPTVFKFRVYFENITEEELNRLRWSLTCN